MDKRVMKWAVVGIVVSLVFIGGVSEGAKEKPLAKVKSEVLTLDDFNKQLEAMPANYAKNLTPEIKKQMVERWIEGELLYQEAKKAGIERREDVRKQLENMRKQVIIQALLQDRQKEIKVSEEEVTSYYETHRNEFQVPEQVKIKHVQATSEEEAAGIVSELKGGAIFEEVAKEKSQDMRTKNKGGDLGYLDRRRIERQYGPEFEKAAFETEVGKVSAPIKGKNGWYVLKIDEKKPSQLQELIQVKSRIENIILREKQKKDYEDFLAGLKEKSKVEKHTELLGEVKAEEAKPPVSTTD